MNKLEMFLQDDSGKLSMMRLISIITAVGGLLLIAAYPEQALPLSTIVVGSQAFKWLQQKGEK
jgi:hypothetical protein